MRLPDPVYEHLLRDYADRTEPFCFRIDADLCLRETWGDPERYGLAGIAIGDSVLDKAPYLLGSVDGRPRKLGFVTTGGGTAVHVHTIPYRDDCYVVLLDASEDHKFLQNRQQAANEYRLLHGNQQRLIRRQNELISDLVETKAELDHRRREAVRDSVAKSRFIAMMSHEFRTPLASIITYSELALDPAVSVMEVRKSLEAIKRSGRHLTSLVEALLDEARLEAGHQIPRASDFSLYELIEDLSAMMAPLAAEKALSYSAVLESDVPDALHADDVSLRQALVNLLGNAIKFTEEGAIRLTVAYNEGRLLAAVSDTGPGIHPSDQERVFLAFERGEHEHEAGAGLGLSITLRLVQLLGGELSLDSAPGKGTTVGLHIPVSVAETPDGDDAVDPFPDVDEDHRAEKPVSVLVCDDDEDTLALVEFYLHRAGYGLMTTQTGLEAIEKTLEYQPDLILMDVNVPDMRGSDAARILRERGYAGPILALTASRLTPAETERFTHCFRKPAPMMELLARIKRLTHQPDG